MGLYHKLLSLQSEIVSVKKNLAIPTKRGEYTALRYEDVFTATRDLLRNNGIFYYPAWCEVTKEGTVTTVHVEYKVVDVETDEKITLSVVGQGEDSFDKGAGKAQTYADKYFLMRLLRLVATDDPDKTSNNDHEELKSEVDELFKKAVKYLDANVRMGKKTPDERREIFKALSEYKNQKRKDMLVKAVNKLEVNNDSEGKG